MSVLHVDIARRTPFPYDYERLDGIVRFAVDPAHPANAGIADLDRAPRDAEGRVRFAADFVLLQPADPGRANRRLLYYVVNRGQRVGVPYNHVPARPATLPPTDEIDVGDGFLMKRGWTVAMCGWQWDVERQPGLMGIETPQALGQDGAPLRGRVAVAFQPNYAHAHQRLAHWPLHAEPGRQALAHTPYPAADLDEPTAELTVRDTPEGPRTAIPRERWRFARDEAGRPVPDDSSVWLAGGFLPGRWYELVYTTRACPVVGTGLLATRDCVAWLRHDAGDNPAAGRLDFTYGHGRSQCGRFLRYFLYAGLNQDEAGRQVFDGLIPHVAGARRGEFNQRYGQPSETNPRGSGGLFPFASDELTDPLTGQIDGLLRRQRQLGGVPRIFTTNTSSEYWRSDCSLIHTDPTGTRDVQPPPEERIYLIAGHQHGPGLVAATDTTPIGARGANRFTMVDGTPVERALLVHLDRWVAEGAEPPRSAFPRLADGTAATREAVLDELRALPGLGPLDVGQLPRLRRPGGGGEPYASYVSAVDADGNEVAGIRVPDVSVPAATHMGWVARHPATGGAGQLLDMMGTTLPFAQTAREQEQRGDPRPAIAARYRDRDAYLAQARTAAERLAHDGFILEQDVDLTVQLAAERYDALAPTPAAATA